MNQKHPLTKTKVTKKKPSVKLFFLKNIPIFEKKARAGKEIFQSAIRNKEER